MLIVRGTRLLWPGPQVRIEAVILSAGTCPAGEFLDDLDQISRKSGVREKMESLFERLGQGHRLSRKRFRKVEDEIWEFKYDQVRILCFSNPGRWICTHGLIKKQDRLPRSEIDRAKQIRSEFLRGLNEEDR